MRVLQALHAGLVQVAQLYSEHEEIQEAFAGPV